MSSVWDEVIGQDSAVDVLQQAARAGALEVARGQIIQERLLDADTKPIAASAMTHAWLFTGPPGSGRSVAARAFAAALECDSLHEAARAAWLAHPRQTEACWQALSTVVPGCGVCRGCRTVLEGSHADLSVLATEKVTITIEEVRDLIQFAGRSPNGGRWRILLVEDTDRMLERTTNVLLKSVEEPAPRTVWLLCAPSPTDLLPTIRSRCRLVNLLVPQASQVAELLSKKDGLPPQLALECAEVSQSHVGVARFLAQHPEDLNRRCERLQAIFSLRSCGQSVILAQKLQAEVDDLCDRQTVERDLAEKQKILRDIGIADSKQIPPSLRAQVRALEEEQKRRAKRLTRDQIDLLLTDITSFLRDCIMLKTAAPVNLINEKLREPLTLWAASCSLEQLNRQLLQLSKAREQLFSNVPPLLVLESLFCFLMLKP